MTATFALRGWVSRSTLLIALVLAGCGSAAVTEAPSAPPSSTPTPTARPTPTPQPTAQATPQASELPINGRIEVTEHGYAVTLPDDWFRIDMDAEAIDEIADSGLVELPEGMQSMLSSQVTQLALSGMSLFAFRAADAEHAVGTTLNVLALPSMGIGLDTLESLNVGQIQAMLGAEAEVETQRVDLPVGEALQIRYSIPVESIGNMGTVQYLVVTDEQQIILTCGTPGEASAILTECDTIAASLELLP